MKIVHKNSKEVITEFPAYRKLAGVSLYIVVTFDLKVMAFSSYGDTQVEYCDISKEFDIVNDEQITDEIIDLFDHIDQLPQEVQNVLNEFSEFENTYESCNQLKARLEPLGYTFDYYLNAEPYNLRLIVTS